MSANAVASSVGPGAAGGVSNSQHRIYEQAKNGDFGGTLQQFTQAIDSVFDALALVTQGKVTDEEGLVVLQLFPVIWKRFSDIASPRLDPAKLDQKMGSIFGKDIFTSAQNMDVFLAMLSAENPDGIDKKAVIEGLFDVFRRESSALLEAQSSVIESQSARKLGGATRWKGKPVAIAKQKALEFWVEWQDGKHPKIRTVEQYALEAMRRWPELKSPKTIAGWSARWSKQRREGLVPSC